MAKYRRIIPDVYSVHFLHVSISYFQTELTLFWPVYHGDIKKEKMVLERSLCIKFGILYRIFWCALQHKTIKVSNI